ncbi:hypothetical protein M8818_004099 [Zalaria obscura]|uniref:Uncharacterized protein n=1 Tax=Zalaria obscura TaxID=2024903 RepID=A0ACC3SH93_9PEZI
MSCHAGSALPHEARLSLFPHGDRPPPGECVLRRRLQSQASVDQDAIRPMRANKAISSPDRTSEDVVRLPQFLRSCCLALSSLGASPSVPLASNTIDSGSRKLISGSVNPIT